MGNKRYGSLRYRSIVQALVAMALISSAVACVSQGGQAKEAAPAVTAVSLSILSPVTAKKPYPAILSYQFAETVDRASIEFLKGYFFWNDEGPFEYTIDADQAVDGSAVDGQLQFRLFPGRASEYVISGFFTYKDTATRLICQTARVSAGVVRVVP